MGHFSCLTNFFKLFLGNGRGDRIRTRGPRFWRPMLYQLSYTPLGAAGHTARKAHWQAVNCGLEEKAIKV